MKIKPQVLTDVWFVGFTLLYFKMVVIPLFSEIKMVDVCKLTSLGNLLVRKITWFVLTTTSASLILSRAFRADHMTSIAYIYSRLPRTHSLTFWLPGTAFSLSLSLSLSLFISTSRNRLTLPDSKTLFNTRNMGAYKFSDLFLTCSAFSVRLVPASNKASEISSNPKRVKQQTWEKTRSSQNILLYFYILIPRMKYLVNIHFIVYRTLLVFSLPPLYSC